jgi:hypothetical protein
MNSYMLRSLNMELYFYNFIAVLIIPELTFDFLKVFEW